MITVAGVVFSITIVALTLASQQFGPRLLRNFMRDTGNQVVLGVFIATFIFCLLVLRTIRGTEETNFVPNLSVTAGVLLALASLGVLIYFIHHAAARIQAPNLIAAVGADLHGAIRRLFPEMLGEGPAPDDRLPAQAELPADFDREARPVLARDSGYVQAVDGGGLLRMAAEEDLVVRLGVRPGDYLVAGALLGHAWPAERITDRVRARLSGSVILGVEPTLEQDVRFAFDQLVEVAVRALSTGINDPFTAMNCLDVLSAELCELAGRAAPSPLRYDDGGVLRVIAAPVTFVEILETSFHRLRTYAAGAPAVTLRLIEVADRLSLHLRRPADVQAVAAQIRLVRRTARRTLPEEDREAVERRCLAALSTLSPRRAA
jgi:uncharacterized membrane protein